MADFGYRAELPSSVVPKYAPRSPGAGAAVGRGLQQLGQAGEQALDDKARTDEAIAASQQRIDLRVQERERAATVAIKTGDLYEGEAALASNLDSMRQNSAPGAAGYGEAAGEEIKNWGDGFLQSIDDLEVRQHFAPIVARTVARYSQREAAYELDSRNRLMGEQAGKAQQIAAATVLANPTTGTFNEQVRQGHYLLEQMGMDGTTLAIAKDRWTGAMVTAVADGRMNGGDTEGVDALLKDPNLAPYLGGPEGVQRYQQRVETQREVQQRAVEAAEKQAQADALEALRVVSVRIDNGDPPPQSEIEAALANARRAGVDESDVLQFAYEGDRAVRAQAALGMETPTIERERATLQRKIEAGKATPEDVRQQEAYDTELDRRATKGADPVAALWKGGEAERQQAVAQVASLPPSERWRVADKVDDRLGILAGLAPRTAQVALQGREIRKDRPGAFMPPKADGKGDEKLARAAFDTFLGRPLMNALGGRYDSVLGTVLDFYAGSQANAGDAGAWSPKAFEKAINVVFGASQRKDGTVQGGLGMVRGHRVELPSLWTAAEFDKGLSRQSFDGAVYGDGTAANKADVLANFRPVVARTRDDGVVAYRFEDASGRALRKADAPGEDWLLWATRSPHPERR